jgi:RNA polymerase sigma factor (sigma-70 family)
VAASSMNTLVQHLRRTLMVRDAAGMTDGQLLHAFITHNDAAAFQALVQRHGPMVLGVCRRILRHQQDAEDAFQATFLVLVRKASSVKPRELVANWLHGVAYHTALKARAVIAKRKMRERQVPEMPEPQAAKPDDWHDLEPLLDEALAGLPDKYRLPILLCDIEGKSIKEATGQLGWPQGTLAGRLARGRKLLARRLSQRGVVLSGAALAIVLAENVALATLPTSLVSATVQAASALAVGKTVIASGVSVNVVALTEGVLKAMMLSKLKAILGVVLVVSIVAFGGGGMLTQDRAVGQDIKTGDGLTFAKTKVAPLIMDETKLHGEWVGKNDHQGNISLFFGPSNAIQRIVENGQDETGTYFVDWTKNPHHLDVKWGNRTVVQTIMEFVPEGKLRIEAGGGHEAARPKGFTDESVILTKKDNPPAGSEKAKADAAKDLAIGEFYQRTDKFGSAFFYYELVRRRYPGTASAKRATELLDELNKHRIRLPDGSAGWETTEPTQPQRAPKFVDQTPTYDGASGQELSQLREQVKKLERRLSELESPPGKRANDDGKLPTRVGQIIVAGNEKTPTADVLKKIPLQPGQILDFSALRQAEEKLAASKVFIVDARKGVRPTVTVVDGDGPFKDILVTVREVESGQRQAEQLLEQALGAKSDVARLPIKMWFGSQGMYLATSTVKVEKDGRIRLVPFRAVILGKGESAQATVVSCEEAVLTLDKPISTIAELGNRRIVATQFVGLAEMKLIHGATPARP